MKAEKLSETTIFEGKIFNIRRDEIREGGSEYSRDIIVHNNSAVIIPFFGDGNIGLVRQYRHAVGKSLLEVPAGLIEKGELPEEGTARELEEEIGVTASNMEKLAEFYASPGFLTEKMYIYLATGLTETAQDLDEDEFVEVERLTFPAVFEMIRNGSIEDAKTVAGLMLAGAKLGYSF